MKLDQSLDKVKNIFIDTIVALKKGWVFVLVLCLVIGGVAPVFWMTSCSLLGKDLTRNSRHSLTSILWTHSWVIHISLQYSSAKEVTLHLQSWC